MGQPIDACPCQTGTLTGSKTLTVTGATNGDVIPPVSINDSVSGFTIIPQHQIPYVSGCGFRKQLSDAGESFREYWLMFTRNPTVDTFGSIPTRFLTMTPVPGLYAVVRLTQTMVAPRAGSQAFFYKRLSAEQSSTIDCDADLSGFTLLEDEPFVGAPTAFDVSGASVSYG